MYSFPRNKTPLYKPTYNQVKEYFEERGSDYISAQRFYAHYEAVGWRIGMNQMVSYKGAIAKWLFKEKDFNKTNGSENRLFDTSGYSKPEKDAQQAQIIKAYEKQRKKPLKGDYYEEIEE